MKIIQTILILLFAVSFSSAQTKTLRSHDYLRMQMEADSTLADHRRTMEIQIQKDIKNRLDNSGVTIPVVIHVIHQGGVDSIGMDQVNSQMTALERDFNQAPTLTNHPSIEAEGFDRLATNMGLSFHLAEINFGDTAHMGVHYVYGTKTDWGLNDDIKDPMQGCAAYNPSNYLNIWVSFLADTVGGFAQMPGGDSITDGIVIDHRMFGSMGTAEMPFDEGKCLTRLVGNYLGLYDIFGMEPCGGDEVDDTPQANGPNFGCITGKHISICGTYPYPVEMNMNFMDATDDACRCLFTIGQKQRIYAYLKSESSRTSLID